MLQRVRHFMLCLQASALQPQTSNFANTEAILVPSPICTEAPKFEALHGISLGVFQRLGRLQVSSKSNRKASVDPSALVIVNTLISKPL